ncbi:hypothetical protein AK00_14515 [Listeria monocytogenes]|uniref:hypothetical protein n=1 Tax=Listeria seeligeri TaxID=1640 RepID=UPI0010E9A707|nr:hypothetical protein [Listeria seeligeri]EAC7139303.1 hypothetical protein [Listeria monocytogenes]HCJ4472158.1 hypothetical protein [Listeria innocua]EAD5544931.1 hypothetical protein [Listeria monocytogenes]EAF9049524.1 hypothetical protein [Listeria monocytogenes]EEO6569042.1 hypothetical protein [Listeria monocytogenes]
MNMHYVTIGEDGYIDGWSNSKEENTIDVLADKSTVNKLFCVKVINKKAVLDQEQYEKLQDEKHPEQTEIEKLREELLLTQEALTALFESNLG